MDIHKSNIFSSIQKAMFLMFIIISLIYIVVSQDELLDEINININNLGEEVGGTEDINGTISGSLPGDVFMWLFICRNSTPTYGRPQEGNIEPSEGNWTQRAEIDTSGTAINATFDIIVILANADDNMRFRRNINREIYIGNEEIRCKKTVKRKMLS